MELLNLSGVIYFVFLPNATLLIAVSLWLIFSLSEGGDVFKVRLPGGVEASEFMKESETSVGGLHNHNQGAVIYKRI